MRRSLLLFLACVACSREAANPPITPAPEPPKPVVEKSDSIPTDLEGRARFVARAFRERDLAAVARVTHPVKGVRFSPYAYVESSHVLLQASQLVARFHDPAKLHFGSHDGSGNPIDLSFAKYIDRFVYDVDFVKAPEVAVDKQLSHGNSLANHAEAYPGARFVEFYFDGFDKKKYGGMDWRSLRLAFEQTGGGWMLVGVIHDEWTI